MQPNTPSLIVESDAHPIFYDHSVRISRVDKTDTTLILPRYAKESDAAFDLCSGESVVLEPNEHRLIRTGIRIAVPPRCVGLIWDRSGLAAKHAVSTLAGVIDSGYRGEVGVVLINHGPQPFIVEKGMRIAQMLVQPVMNHLPILEVEQLESTERGDDGFGSTGR